MNQVQQNCIFCRIQSGEFPAKKLYEDEHFFIIADIEPKAKYHYLAIPKSHYATLDKMTKKSQESIGHIFKTIASLKQQLCLQNGYRLIINQGEDAGQTVFHLHIHIMAGQKMDFPHF